MLICVQQGSNNNSAAGALIVPLFFLRQSDGVVEVVVHVHKKAQWRFHMRVYTTEGNVRTADASDSSCSGEMFQTI